VEILLPILLELIASEVWEKVKERYAKPEPTWAEHAVRSLEPSLGRSLTRAEREGVTRWLLRPDVFSALAVSTAATLTDDVSRVVNALEYELGPPDEMTKSLAASIVAAVVVHVTDLVDPGVAATLSTHRSLKGELADLKLGQGVIYEGIQDLRSQLDDLAISQSGPELDAVELARLPTHVGSWIRAAHANGADGGAMLRWLRDPVRVRPNLVVLTSDPPSWLLASGDLWVATGFAAETYDLNSEAIIAFERAAELLPDRRSELLARAALAASRAAEPARAHALLQRAAVGASDTDLLFIGVVDAAIAEDVAALEERAIQALTQAIPDATMVRAWLGRAQVLRNDLDAAASTFEAGAIEATSHAGYLLAYADALLRRAFGQLGGHRVKDSQKALDLALVARNLRRGWGGDSAEATVTACQAAFSLERYSDVIALGSDSEGEATEAEASHPEVRQLLALAKLIEGGQAPEPNSPFERSWFLGLSLSRDPATRADAIHEFEQAAQLASNEGELDRAQRSLANIGHLAIPRLDEVRERDADHAEALLAIADTNAGNLEAAAVRLRPLIGRSRIAVLQLSEAYVQQGKAVDAADLLRTGGVRFGDVRLLLQAARLLLKLGRIEQSTECLILALPLAPPPSPLRREARWIEVEIAVKYGDPASVEAAASTAISEGEDSPAIRWVRVESLTKLHRLKDAWTEIRATPVLTPDTEGRARLFLQLLMRREPSRLDLMAEVIGSFPDSHEVQATGISLFLAFDPTEPRDDLGVAAMQAHVARFLEKFPDSPALRSVEVNVDDPEEFREQMRQMLNPDPERDRQHRQLAEQAASGQLPIGFAASIFSRGYLDSILNGSTVGFTSIPRDPVVLDQEIQLATEQLDQPIVADLSSLVAMTFAPDLWPTVLASFTSVSISDATFAEIDDSIFRKTASGSMRWDHQQDSWTMVEFSPEQLEAVRLQRNRLRVWASELPVVNTGTLADVQGLEAVQGENTWAAGLATAHSRSCALLCDDVALAAIARSIGVPAFGSFALAIALARAGRLANSAFDELITVLFGAQADDLPLTPAQITGLAESVAWPLAPTLHPISRPHYWRDPQAAYAGFVTTIEGLGGSADAAANALYAAGLGVIRAVAAGSPLPLITGLFVAAILRVQAEPADAATLVAAVRAACNYYELDDPFEVCVRAVLDVVGAAENPATAAQFVTTLFSTLEPRDRAVATAIVLGATKPDF
jgi:tetratricopeptide (TPR) repeat protein